jgi:hypothetical protein
VVVEAGPVLEQPWLETTRRQALERMLTIELRSLPLRVQAGVWLTEASGPRRLIPPASALALKDRRVRLPHGLSQSPSAAARLAACAAALEWLRTQGGGSLVYVATAPFAGPSSRDLSRLPWGGGEVFAHALALDLAAGESWLRELVRLGGGALFRARRPARLGGVLHRAVKTALASARLLIQAFAPDNRPLRLAYRLERSGALYALRPGVTGRAQQLLPGVYGLVWTGRKPVGPAPAKVTVSPGTLTRLLVGGRGRVTVLSQDREGRPLAWRMRVARSWDGKVLLKDRRTPFTLSLPSGLYLIKALNHPLAWPVLVEAGAELRLVVGPWASLTVGLKGPRGAVRVPYRLTDLWSGRPAGVGYTNQVLRLRPGRYRLEVEVVPALRREVELAPGREVRIVLPEVGGLLVRRRPEGGRRWYELLDARGRSLGRLRPGQVFLLRPGRYGLRPAGSSAPGRVVVVSAGRVTSLALSAGAH